MPLKTTVPVTSLTAQSVETDETVIESVTTNRLWTRSEGELFEQRIERFWLLEGQVVNSKVVTVPPAILAAQLSRPEIQAAYALLREAYYAMLKAMGEAPAESQLVDNAPDNTPENLP